MFSGTYTLSVISRLAWKPTDSAAQVHTNTTIFHNASTITSGTIHKCIILLGNAITAIYVRYAQAIISRHVDQIKISTVQHFQTFQYPLLATIPVHRTEDGTATNRQSSAPRAIHKQNTLNAFQNCKPYLHCSIYHT